MPKWRNCCSVLLILVRKSEIKRGKACLILRTSSWVRKRARDGHPRRSFGIELNFADREKNCSSLRSASPKTEHVRLINEENDHVKSYLIQYHCWCLLVNDIWPSNNRVSIECVYFEILPIASVQYHDRLGQVLSKHQLKFWLFNLIQTKYFSLYVPVRSPSRSYIFAYLIAADVSISLQAWIIARIIVVRFTR